MIEPILQDYITAIMGMDRNSFYQRIGVAILISQRSKKKLTFQTAKTEMSRDMPHSLQDHSPLDHLLPVFELRKNTEGPTNRFHIGRSEDNDIVIHDDTVSSYHAVIYLNRDNNQYSILDLDTTNGTKINADQIAPSNYVLISDGDMITFGKSKFLFYTAGGLYDRIRPSIGEN
jgi:pSer/pThr/pTyr-binding forkhead associated (FHA) protein